MFYSSNEISTFEKKSLFLKNEGDGLIGGHSVQATSNRLIHAHISFIHRKYVLSVVRKAERNGKNVGRFWPLFAILRHFLTSDVILKENFCRLASIWLIDLMKLFALGRIDSAVGRKLWLAGKVAKFTEMVVIPLRILSSVGDA
mgnify:CR=1 FL=1